MISSYSQFWIQRPYTEKCFSLYFFTYKILPLSPDYFEDLKCYCDSWLLDSVKGRTIFPYSQNLPNVEVFFPTLSSSPIISRHQRGVLPLNLILTPSTYWWHPVRFACCSKITHVVISTWAGGFLVLLVWGICIAKKRNINEVRFCLKGYHFTRQGFLYWILFSTHKIVDFIQQIFIELLLLNQQVLNC